jgi:uncharacterized YigZ family protein
MRTVTESWRSETEVKRSRFLAHLVPYDDFPGLQKRLKSEHPKANHVAYAYRHINKYGHVEEGSGDDGEPRGCAGVPILNVMRGEDLVECAILVVRYFGGVRLGTGGMARAYGTAARSVVDIAGLGEWVPLVTRNVFVPFARIRRAEHLLRLAGAEILERSFDGDGVRWRIRGSRESVERFLWDAREIVRPE